MASRQAGILGSTCRPKDHIRGADVQKSNDTAIYIEALTARLWILDIIDIHWYPLISIDTVSIDIHWVH